VGQRCPRQKTIVTALTADGHVGLLSVSGGTGYNDRRTSFFVPGDSSSSTATQRRHVVARECDLDEEETRNWRMAKVPDLRSFINAHRKELELMGTSNGLHH
jgi:hypothetical protein